MTDGSGLSVADTLAITRGSENGLFGGDGGGFITILLLFFLMSGGNMFGTNGANRLEQGVTQAQMFDGLFNQTSNAMAMDLKNGQCEITKEVLENRYANALQTQTMSAQFAQCCCETNRNIDNVKYEGIQNTAAIIAAGTANTQRILDTLCQNEIQSLRDRLNESQRLQDIYAQNATLISTLRPFPQPAYITCSPYTTACTM